MKKLSLITSFLLLSVIGYSQTIADIVNMKSDEVKLVLDSLSKICDLPSEGWINSPSGNPLRPQNKVLKVIHIGSFEDYSSRRNIEMLNKIQRQLPQIPFLIIGNSSFDFLSSESDYKPLLNQLNIALPFLPDSIYKKNPCVIADSNIPTTLILTPDNRIIQEYRGALNIDELVNNLVRLRDVMLVFYDMNSTLFLGKTPKQFSKSSIIGCPTGLAIDEIKERIFVSDYCENRIFVLSPFGELLDVIGTGKQGNKNGYIYETQLNGPQGLAYDVENEVLYVADSHNNAIKEIDLKTMQTQAISTSDYFSQPENLTISAGQLFISAKGAIWKMNITSKVFEVIYNEVGSTSPDKINQPSGIAITESGIVILTDNLGSTVKYIENGELNSPVTSAKYGYADGKKEEVKFYYPNGIEPYNGGFLIADTYNNCIRWYDPFKRKSKTIAGNGESGIDYGNALKSSFSKPFDIAILNDVAYITDSGSGLIRMLDLEDGTLANMSIINYSKLCFGYTPTIKDFRNGDTLYVSSGDNNISLKLNLSGNYQLDKNGLSQANITTRSKKIKITDSSMDDQTIEFIIDSGEKSETLVIDYILFFVSKTQPELQYKRTASYLFPIVYKPQLNNTSHEFEFTFDPN